MISFRKLEMHNESHNESISCFGTWLSTTNVERSLGAPAAQKTKGRKVVREILSWNLES